MRASLVAQLVKKLPAYRRFWFNSWVGKITWRRDRLPFHYSWASLVAQTVKNPPAMWETWVQSLGQEDPLEESMATHCKYSCLENPVDRGAWWVIVHGVAKESDTAEQLNHNQ